LNAGGNAYALKKDYKRAIADSQMFLKLEPEHSYAPTIRGLIENWKKLIK
jgi:regulator of sirC expression with transglutaminase-like and TPR domain